MTTQKPLKNNVGLRASVIEERRALLQRVLWSRHFEKATRLRDLLAYVCERALDDPSAEIHEQEVGHRVFGRASDYDTSADNIVRVTASQARKKLEQYFAAEGASESIILEIPKGQYLPLFRERTIEIASDSATPPPSNRALKIAVIALAAGVLVLAGMSLFLELKLRSERQAARSVLEANPALNSLWSQLLSANEPTDIVLADSSLSLFQELLDRPLTLAEYLNPGVWGAAPRLASNPELQTFAQRAAQRRFTSMASVTAVLRIAQIAGRDQSRIRVLSARDFNVRQMKSDHVILIGSSRANPWAELIQDRLNFRFNFDQTSRYSFFENRQPRPGEPDTYRTDSSASYCQIAFLPNLGRTGNVLAIYGTEIEGTEGGSEFVTAERTLTQLRSLLKADPDARMPYFEVLLKGGRVGGASEAFSITAVRSPKP